MAREPSQTSNVAQAGGAVYVDAAVPRGHRAVDPHLALWPRSAALYKRLAEAQHFAGQKQKAIEAEEAALRIDGGDLQLRRSVERAKTGKELLSDLAVDGKTAISAYEAHPGSEEASTAVTCWTLLACATTQTARR